MTVNEKLSLCGDGFLHLFREGVFWIGYESSAYLLNIIRPLKATKKEVRVAGMEVVRVGFPVASLDGFLEHFKVCERTETYIRAAPSEAVDFSAFDKWKLELPAYAPKRAATLENGTQVSMRYEPVRQGESGSGALPPGDLYERVRGFRLSAATPMECMRFIEELQNGM